MSLRVSFSRRWRSWHSRKPTAGFHTGRSRYFWPGLLIATGLFLPALMLIHPTLAIMRAHAMVILADMQQQRHLAMALLLLGAGVAEAVAIRRPSRMLRTIWPLSLASIGMLFLLHPQHGTATRSTRQL